jgi:DNA (cytosine-5)-methyltransferase 1
MKELSIESDFSTEYSKSINELLVRKKLENPYKVLDLFAGCGGLALGFEAVGFQTIGFEQDIDCCQTYSDNLQTECYQVLLDNNTELPNADIIIGGPPCQPFSVGGEQLGILDARNGFPIFINAIKKINPKMWMFENVRGLLYKNKWYLDEVLNTLESLGYQIEYKLMNFSDYGVPQNRERLIVVGHKNKFSFPKVIDKKITAFDALGHYYDYEPDDGKYLTQSMDEYVKKYEIASKCINPRDLHKEKPSRTLTCRNLAGATGDMLRLVVPSGRRRRLLIQEAARLQSFPDWYRFQGKEASIFKQIGNAVPPLFSYYLALEFLKSLNSESTEEIIRSKLPKQLTIWN